MRKVLVFGMTGNPGGIESVIMNYYRYINRSRIQFDFLCNCPKIAYEEEITEFGGKIYTITARRENYFEYKKELTEFMILHAHEYNAIWVNVCSLVNIDYLIYAKKYGIQKRIIHCHNSENDGGMIKLIIHNCNKKRIYKYATDYWSCSEDAAPWFFDKAIVNSVKYRVIPNAIDVKKYQRSQSVREEYRKKLGLENKIVIGHVGRFHFQKNHHFLIDIFEELAKRKAEYHLLLVGQGELEQNIKKLVKNKKLENKVTFLGVRSDLCNIYQAMDCFVMPSKFEGLGIVILEAQAAQVPCVLSDTIPFVVRVNDNVIFISLQKEAKEWADEIENSIFRNNSETKNKMIGIQYDISTQIENFERMLF